MSERSLTGIGVGADRAAAYYRAGPDLGELRSLRSVSPPMPPRPARGTMTVRRAQGASRTKLHRERPVGRTPEDVPGEVDDHDTGSPKVRRARLERALLSALRPTP